MFSSKQILLKKTGPDGIGRHDFLRQLITEFTTTKSTEAKQQTLANLANFAYDPINFEFLKQLHVIDLFIDQLDDEIVDLQHFALAGLCNISPDLESKEYIIGLNGITRVAKKLLHKKEEIAVNALTCLYYLIFPKNKHLVTPDILENVKLYQSSTNVRYKNLGTVFLEEYRNAENNPQAT